MRIATYNVAWFEHLFTRHGDLVPDGASAWHGGVTRAEQIDALITVFRAIDADAILIIEAPDEGRRAGTVRKLKAFAEAAGIRARQPFTGFTNGTQQEIAFLFDPDVMEVMHDPGESLDAPRFDGTFRIDLDIDATEDEVDFSKPPLELEIIPKDGRAGFHLIGAHLKSKAPHGAKGKHEILRRAIANRRKQLAQAIWLRRRIATHLAEGRRLVVAGDLNDGPGLDEYEKLFGRSSAEIVMGSGDEALFDPHADEALSQRVGAQPSTARFYIAPRRRFLQALLDYIMVSPVLRPHAHDWRIWHPFDDPDCWRHPLGEALLAASDHYPVSVELDL
ncbi:endonuclease/exonuclease/phosphatase family protein [Litorisediminicola beolgyonensis]|uniref:Endonuclease/exonuclease/phosphatase family protein n=1 Tax=Litorisediminicola beolgyonensis TaxID=1173614 RepID=A0ABW3ZFC8_9RHOB